MTICTCLSQGFPEQEKLNCAEQIIYAANIAYNMGLSKDACKLSAGFGGGMGIMSVCGAISAGSMVLSNLFVKDYAHEGNKEISRLTKELINNTEASMSSYMCKDLRAIYRTPANGCKATIEGVAKILDDIIALEMRKKNEENAK